MMVTGSFTALLNISLFACISAFLFGYDLGLIGGALPRIQEELGTSDALAQGIVGAAKLGAVLGAFLGAIVMKLYGRRPAMVFDVFFFLVGPLCMVIYPNAVLVISGRFLLGIGIGVSAVVVPAYLGEVSPSMHRGRMVGLYEVMLCLGMLCASLVDALVDSMSLSWKWMVGLPALPALCMGIFVWSIPESPRWLVSEGRLEEALRVMHRMYTALPLPEGEQSSTAEVEAELLELWDSVQKEQEQQKSTNSSSIELQGVEGKEEIPLLNEQVGNNSHSDQDVPVCKTSDTGVKKALLGVPEIFRDIYFICMSDERRAFLTVLALAMFNQACGSTSIINYAPIVLEEEGIDSDAKATLFSATLGLSKLVGVIVSFSLVDNLGRRPLLLFGSAGSVISLSLLAVSDAFSNVTLIITSMSLFILFFSLSWAEVFWIILSEVFSMKRKSAAIAACTATLFLFGSVTDLLFLTIRNFLGFGSFVVYAGIALMGGIFVYFFVPETKGKTLMQVQEAFNA